MVGSKYFLELQMRSQVTSTRTQNTTCTCGTCRKFEYTFLYTIAQPCANAKYRMKKLYPQNFME